MGSAEWQEPVESGGSATHPESRAKLSEIIHGFAQLYHGIKAQCMLEKSHKLL